MTLGLVGSGALLVYSARTEKPILYTLAIIALGLLIGLSLYGVDSSANKAYKEALKGNNPYEIKVVYEQQDSTYIPVDTLFIKKEE